MYVLTCLFFKNGNIKTPLLEELYKIEEPRGSSSANSSCVNMEGGLDKLPTGRRKATFWNAWKRRHFKLQDGILLCYQVTCPLFLMFKLRWFALLLISCCYFCCGFINNTTEQPVGKTQCGSSPSRRTTGEHG